MIEGWRVRARKHHHSAVVPILHIVHLSVSLLCCVFFWQLARPILAFPFLLHNNHFFSLHCSSFFVFILRLSSAWVVKVGAFGLHSFSRVRQFWGNFLLAFWHKFVRSLVCVLRYMFWMADCLITVHGYNVVSICTKWLRLFNCWLCPCPLSVCWHWLTLSHW